MIGMPRGRLRREAVLEFCNDAEIARMWRIHRAEMERRQERLEMHERENQHKLNYEQTLARTHSYRHMYVHPLLFDLGLADSYGRPPY